MEFNKIYHEDCLEGMRRLPEASVDMVLADLPYGVLKSKETSWDTKLPFDELWKHYSRVLKPNGVVVLTGVHPFTNEIINSIPKGWKYYETIWHKSVPSGFLNAKRRFVNAHENVLIIYRKQPKYNPQKYKVAEVFQRKSRAKQRQYSRAFGKISGGKPYSYADDGTRYPDTVFDFVMKSVLPVQSVSRKGQHPTEKPVELFALLIRTFTDAGEVVLDNCAGSGTTAVACLLEGRQFICFETSKDYVEMAEERLAKVRLELD